MTIYDKMNDDRKSKIFFSIYAALFYFSIR